MISMIPVPVRILRRQLVALTEEHLFLTNDVRVFDPVAYPGLRKGVGSPNMPSILLYSPVQPAIRCIIIDSTIRRDEGNRGEAVRVDDLKEALEYAIIHRDMAPTEI